MDEAQAAEALGVTPRFLADRRVKGGGPEYIRISHRCVRYRPEDLRAWLGERRYASTAEERDV